MIDQAIILAAGMGSRIRGGRDNLPKPLHQVAGQTLIKRTILTLARGGVRKVFVIVGYRAAEVRRALEKDPEFALSRVAVECIDNPEYMLNNGVSLLQARPRVSGPFLLAMADHIFDVSLVEQAASAELSGCDLRLCVDRRVDEVYDLDDATKVVTDGRGRIVTIGKRLETFDAVDCGVFACTPALLDALEDVRARQGDCCVSDGVQELAAAGRAAVLDIGDVFWQDVDTPGAQLRAHRELLARAAPKVKVL